MSGGTPKRSPPSREVLSVITKSPGSDGRKPIRIGNVIASREGKHRNVRELDNSDLDLAGHSPRLPRQAKLTKRRAS